MNVFLRLRSLWLVVSGVALYAIVLLLPVPQAVGLAFRYDATYIAALLLAAFYLAYRLPGWKGEAASLLLSFGLFALPLNGLWSSSVRDSFVLGGLLPTGDATRFYLDAQRLLEGWQIESTAWRPIFPGALAVLLGLSGQHLQFALAVLGAVAALATHYAGRALRASHGAAGGALLVLLLFFYARRFSGLTMSENLGLSLAALAFALLWRTAAPGGAEEGFVQGAAARRLAGIFMLGLALFTRPGAFLALPALVLWAGWQGFSARRRLSAHFWPPLGLAAAAVLLAALLNTLLTLAVALPGANNANFDLTLYGQVSGGMGWNQVHIDHPEVRDLPQPEHSQRIYALAWDLFRRQPGLLAQGVLNTYAAFFSISPDGLFGFCGKGQSDAALALRLLLLALSACGLYAAARRLLSRPRQRPPGAPKDEGWALLLLFALPGICLSIPFVPPWDGSGMRLYAATMPLMLALPAVGLAELYAVAVRLSQRISASAPPPEPAATAPPWGAEGNLASRGAACAELVLAAVLVLWLFAGSLAVRFSARLPQLVEAACPPGMAALDARLAPGSFITVVNDRDVPATRLPYLRKSEFYAGNHAFGDSQVADALDALPIPTTITNVMDLQSGKTAWLFLPAHLAPPPGSLLRACGHWSAQPELSEWFFYADGGILTISTPISTGLPK